MNDQQLFRQTRWRLAYWYAGVMGVILGLSGLGVYEALGQAATILVDLFNPLKDVTFTPVEELDTEEEDENNQIPIEGLNLSVRAYNCLKRAQINSVADLLGYSQEDLLEIKNFGAKSAEEVIQALQDHLGITMQSEKSKNA